MTIRESIKYIERLYKEIKVMKSKFEIEKDFEDNCDVYDFSRKRYNYFYKNMSEIIDKIDEYELSTLKYWYTHYTKHSGIDDNPLYKDIDPKYLSDIARTAVLRDNSEQY